MNGIAVLLFVVTTLSSVPATTLILRSGEHYDIQGPIREENGRVIFQQAGGALYSIPVAEVDFEATRAAAATPIVVRLTEQAKLPAKDAKKLRVSDAERERLLRELEKNHSGTPAEPQKELEVSAPSPTAEEKLRNPEEWEWRHRARDFDEAVRRAQENLDLLKARIEQLERQILGFTNLGYKAGQFTYQTSELQIARDQLPAAELEVTRAKRANDQFREDARKQGILPGWLR
jgi:hypothetical protein